MAVTFATESVKREGALYTDFPENILIVPDLNGRHEHTEIESLAADIAINGQRTPVLIRKSDSGQPVLVYGHRRWRAVKLLNERAKSPADKVKLVCNYEALTDEEAFAAAIAENRFRSDLTPMDDCHNINHWFKRFKKTAEDVARIYFPEATKPEAIAEAVRWVKNRAALVELAPEAAEAVRDGSATVTAAVELTKLSKDQQREVVAQSTSKVGGKKRIKVSDVKKAKPASRKASPAPAPAPAPKAASSVYAAAEAMACAVDVWIKDATDRAEKALIASYKDYRRLVPMRQASKAA